MNILFLACFGRGRTNYGGAEKSITNLANWIAQNTEHEVFLYSVDGPNKPYAINEKVVFDFADCSENNKIKKHIVIAKNSRRIVKKYKPDIVISFWIQPLFYLFGMRGFKIFYSERNDPRLDYSWIARFMRSRVLKKSRAIVFQTNDAKNYFSKAIQDKSYVIHNPVYLKKGQYCPTKEYDNRIVSVGRLCNQKNYPLLIKAFKAISSDYPHLHLEIYGEGPLRDELQSLIDQQQLAEKIKLMGAYPDVIQRIYGARLFLMTSKYEGMPNALMEAMCLGIPVLCSDCPCGGPSELIRHGENGFLFRNEDLEDCIEKLKIALEDNNCKDMPTKEQLICETHSEDNIFTQWKEIILE